MHSNISKSRLFSHDKVQGRRFLFSFFIDSLGCYYSQRFFLVRFNPTLRSSSTVFSVSLRYRGLSKKCKNTKCKNNFWSCIFRCPLLLSFTFWVTILDVCLSFTLWYILLPSKHRNEIRLQKELQSKLLLVIHMIQCCLELQTLNIKRNKNGMVHLCLHDRFHDLISKFEFRLANFN